MARKSTHTEGPPTGNSLVPVPRIEKPDPTKRGGLTIGPLLELARRRAGYSESAACLALNITEYELGRYESGMRTPSQALLEEFAVLYDADFSGEEAPGERHLRLGWADIDLADCTDNTSRLRRISASLRSIRRVDVDVPLVVRTDELPLFAEALDIEDPELVGQLSEWLALSETQASELAERLRSSVG